MYKPYNTQGWLFFSALWESFYILQPQWWFINSYSLESRMGMDSFKWTRSDTAPLWTVAWCLFWWWWLNVFLCCISISFALLLSIPQIPHPAKTLHGQCQAISENTFCCFKNGWRNAAKDSTGFRKASESVCGVSHTAAWICSVCLNIERLMCEGIHLLNRKQRNVFTDSWVKVFVLFSDCSVKIGNITVLY